ncbi:hypothetical protein PFWH6_3154 [Pseudomonas fluorescens WH6]|nr:hypothetical protein PFWH6_3154 [Pseudomonas fluorescens WH6]
MDTEQSSFVLCTKNPKVLSSQGREIIDSKSPVFFL